MNTPWAPTGDTQHLIVVTSPDELTCLGCGETFVGKMCYRCGVGDDGSRRVPSSMAPVVRTVDYLKPGEYRYES